MHCRSQASDEDGLTEAFLFALQEGVPQSVEGDVYEIISQALWNIQHSVDTVRVFNCIAESILERVQVFKVQPAGGTRYAQDTVARLLESYTDVLRSILDDRREETPMLKLNDLVRGIYRKRVVFAEYNHGLQSMIATLLEMRAQLNWEDPHIHQYIGAFLVNCGEYAYEELSQAFAQLDEEKRKRIATGCALRLFRSEPGALGHVYVATTDATRNGVVFLCRNMHMHIGDGVDPWVDELMDELWQSHEKTSAERGQRIQQQRNNMQLMKDLFNAFYATELQKQIDSFKFPTQRFSIGDKVDCTTPDGVVLRNWEVVSAPSEGTYTIMDVAMRPRDCNESSISLAEAPSNGAHHNTAPDVVELLLTKAWTKHMIENVDELRTMQELKRVRQRDQAVACDSHNLRSCE